MSSHGGPWELEKTCNLKTDC